MGWATVRTTVFPEAAKPSAGGWGWEMGPGGVEYQEKLLARKDSIQLQGRVFRPSLSRSAALEGTSAPGLPRAPPAPSEGVVDCLGGVSHRIPPLKSQQA